MRYWWVNHKQTFRHEFEGGYIWSPKRNRDLSAELDQRFNAAAVVHDVGASRKIVEWAYFHTEQAQG